MPNLPKITPEIINAYREEIAKSGSASTARRKDVSIKRFFDWAHESGKIEENPFQQKVLQISQVVNVSKAKNKPGLRVVAITGLTLSLAVLIFLLTRKLQFPIPFIPNFAFSGVPESQIQTVQNNNIYNQFGNASPSAIPASSAVISSYNLFTKLKLTDSAGSPQVGSETLTFKIYDQENGGKVLYTSDPQVVTTDSSGSTLISLDKVPTDLFFQNQKLFLEPEIGTNPASARIPVSTASTPSNLGGYFPANPDTGANAETVPVLDASGSLNLAGSTPAVNAKAGNLLIQGQAITVRSAMGSNGNIEISPDGFGITHFLFQGNGENLLNAQAPNLTNGSLFYGEVSNNANGAGYNLIKLQSGSSLSTKFSVNGNGQVFAAGDFNTFGNLQTQGATRVTANGGLTNITGYSQNSGNFIINQNPGDLAAISKTGTALSDVLTLTLDEHPKPQYANTGYSTLVLNRFDGAKEAMALLVKNGNAQFNGQLQLGNFSTNPGTIGTGSLIYNSSDNHVYVWNGSAWQQVGASTTAFSAITSGTNTTAAMVVGSGASLNYTGTGTINSSSLEGATWEVPGTIGSTTPNTGAFTTLSTTGAIAANGGSVTTNQTTANLFTSNATTINLGINGSGSVNVGGGSGANGCTFNDATGALTCAGNISTTSTSGTQGWWNQTSGGTTGGVLYPINGSVDLLLGGTATTSAKFAFKNVLTGLPTATISGDIANVATYLTGDGNLATTNMANLTIGGSTTGNITLNPLNSAAGGFVAPNTTNVSDLGLSGKLWRNIYGTTIFQGANQVCDTGGNCSGVGGTIGGGGTLNFIAKFTPDGSHIGNSSLQDNGTTLTSSDTALTLGGSATINGGTGASGTLTLTSTTNAAKGNIQFFSSSYSIDPSGNSNLNAGTFAGNLAVNGSAITTTSTTFTALAGATTTLNIGANGSGTINLAGGSASNGCSLNATNGNFTCAGNISTTSTSGTQGWWNQTSGGTTGGVLYPINSTVDLLLGGTATTSAKFAFKGINSGTPTASISGSLANVATFIDGNGNISSTNRNNLTLGNSSTYNTTGNILLNPNGTGNVGIGTTSPTNKLTVSSSSAVDGILVQNSAGGSAAIVDIQSIDTGGVDWRIQSLGNVTNRIGNLEFLTAGGSPFLTIQKTSGNVGIGTSSPTALLDVAGNASVSGTLAFHAGTGTIQSTTMSPLVIGGNTTGNITLNPLNALAGGYVAPNTTDVTDLGTSTLEYRNVYGNNLTTNNTGTANLFNTNATTLNIGGAATTINMQGASGLTMNLGNANGATALNLTSGTGAQTFTSSNATGITTAGSFVFNDAALTTGDLIYANGGGASFTGNLLKLANNSVIKSTIDASGNLSTLGVIQTNATSTSLGYNRFGTGATTSNGLSTNADVLITGKEEVNGTLFLNGLNIANSHGTSTIAFCITASCTTTPNQVENTLTAGSWLVQNPAGGNVGQAALMVDQDMVNRDIFTASASGITKFTISNSGQVGIGTTPGKTLDVAGDIRLTGKFFDSNVTAGISLGDSSNTALVGFGAGSLVGALNELKNSSAETSHNDYTDWANQYLAKAEGTLTNPNMTPQGLFFDTFADTTKMDSVNSTSSGAIQVSDPGAPNVKPASPFRVGLSGGQIYNSTTKDNDNTANYLGSNTVNKIFYYDRSKDSTPLVQTQLGIDPNWYNGVTLSVATTSAQLSQNDTIWKPNPNLSTTYNGSLIKATGTYASNARTIYITIKSPTTFDWTDYNGNSATAVTITPGTAQTLGGTGVSVTFTNVNYNTGDVFKIASWFTEPSTTTTRGAKAQFPERSYIVVESNTVDAIDADTQKLWMRFSLGASNIIGTSHVPNSANVLNGKLYIADTFATMEFVDFGRDSAGYYDTTGINQYKGSVSQRNSGSGTFLLSGSPTLVNNIVNDVSAAVIPNQPTQTVTTSGWGYIQGNGTATISETVNLPYRFNSTPIVVPQVGGFASSVPTSLASCTSSAVSGGTGASADSSSITNNNFVVTISRTSLTYGSGFYICYTWTATGTVSPKQFVAAAEGNSTSGGTDIINETDGTDVSVITGGHAATTGIWQNKVAFAGNALYLANNNNSTNATNLSVYYGIHGLGQESGAGNFRRGTYGLGAAGNFTPVVLGTATGTSQINSLAVTSGTSTIDGKSNTIYVGTTSGLTVVQEKQGLGNSVTNPGEGLGDENSGSVKYYTKDYVSEEMVSDIRLMTPFAGTSALSANTTLVSPDTDVSVKAVNLTTLANAVPTHVSGVRGKGLSFAGGTNELLCTGTSGTCADNTNLTVTTGVFSTGVWVKTSTSSRSRFIEKRGATTNGYLLGIGTNGKAEAYVNDGTNSIDLSNLGNKIINDNNWHHVVLVRDTQTTIKVYVDGALDISGSNASLGSLTTTQPFTIAGIVNGTSELTGSLDEIFFTATALTQSQIKHMYDVGYRALQGHATTLGGGGADSNQQLGGSTNTVGDARPDFNNQFMYVGTNDATNGRVSKIDLNSDSNLKTFDKTANTPTGGTKLANDDTNSLAVSYNLEAVASATTGVESMSPDNNSNNLTGSLFSKTQTLNSNTKFAYLWTSFVVDSSDTSNGINIYACNNFSTKALCDSNSAWVLGTIANTDSSQTPPEREYTFSFPNAGSNMTFKFDFARGSTKTNTYITRYGATWASSVGGADIAERYQSTEPVFPGDVLSIASPVTDGTASVSMSRAENDPKIIGVVTTNPGIVMDNNLVDLNFNAASRNSPDRPAVALAGRVPLNVSTKNGPILVGDPLTSSPIAGFAVKSTHVGNIVAKALEAFSCSSPNATQMPDGTCQGQVLALINVSWFDPSIYLTDTGDLHITSTQSASVANSNQSPTIVYQIIRVLTDGTKEIVDQIGTFGKIVTANIEAGAITARDFTADNLIARQIQTKLISPLADGTDVTVKIGSEATPSGQFVIQNATGSAVATIDTAGNATFSGIVHSQNIDAIQELLNQVATDQNILLAATSGANLNSTASATFGNLIASDFYVTSHAAVNSLLVNTDLTTQTINSLSGPLKIESLAIAPVEIMDGLVTIDTHGNVQIAGDLNVAGRIKSSGLTLKGPTFKDPVLQGGNATDSAELLTLQDQTGTQVAGVNASGSAQFNSLTTPQLVVAAPDATSAATVNNGVITTNSTVGQATVPAGISEITIKNPKVTDYTLVYVTPTSSTNNYVLYVKSKQNGQFVVGFDQSLPMDVKFNWWIVGIAN